MVFFQTLIRWAFPFLKKQFRFWKSGAIIGPVFLTWKVSQPMAKTVHLHAEDGARYSLVRADTRAPAFGKPFLICFDLFFETILSLDLTKADVKTFAWMACNLRHDRFKRISATTIARETRLSNAALSRSISALADCRLIDVRREGRQTVFVRLGMEYTWKGPASYWHKLRRERAAAIDISGVEETSFSLLVSGVGGPAAFQALCEIDERIYEQWEVSAMVHSLAAERIERAGFGHLLDGVEVFS